MEGRMQPTVAPPLDPAELGEALRELGQSRMLPRVAYTSGRVLAFELERLFAGSWVCVARAEDLPDPGDRLAVQVGDVGVLVVRDRDATLRAFANVCRHRGHELLPAGASASARSVVCPYHAWAYRLDGSLRAAPGMRDAEGFEPPAHALVGLPLEVWHGFVMVNASGDAVEFWNRTNRQDWAACESVQRGMANPHFRPGPLAPGEDAVYRFETLIARAYLGEYPG